MNRPRTTTLPRTHGVVLGHQLGAWLGGALLLALPLAARADAVVLPDPTAAAEQAELSGAVSLLVRSYLKPGTRPIAASTMMRPVGVGLMSRGPMPSRQ